MVQLFCFSIKIVCARETRERSDASDASDLNGIVRSHRIASCNQFTRACDLWREKGDFVIIKFHFWNLSGYSDLSVEEGTVGGRERICVE